MNSSEMSRRRALMLVPGIIAAVAISGSGCRPRIPDVTPPVQRPRIPPGIDDGLGKVPIPEPDLGRPSAPTRRPTPTRRR